MMATPSQGFGTGRAFGFLLILLLGLAQGGGAFAQDDKRAAREREALRRAQAEAQRLNAQMQTLEAERSKLSAEAGAKEKALTDAQTQLKQREKAEKGLRGELKTRLAKAREEMEKLELKFAEISGQLKDVTERNAQNETTLKTRDAEIRDLQARLAAQREIIARQGGMLTDADRKNRELVKVSRDLMERYRDKGVMDALLQKEPFTRVEKVRVQNTLQEYEEKVESHRLAQPETGG